jgi:hypothetical protein
MLGLIIVKQSDSRSGGSLQVEDVKTWVDGRVVNGGRL